MNDKNLIVLFPGRGYAVDRPLLYYARYKYMVKGYESIAINYGDFLNNDSPFEIRLENTVNHALEQIKHIDFASFDDVLFVSKSVGTVVAGAVAVKLETNIRHIILTPLEETLQYLKNNINISIVVAGTKDDFINADILKAHCEREQIQLELIENADHSLAINGQVDENIDILKRVVSLY